MQELMTHYRPYMEGETVQALFLFQAGTVWASLESVYRCCVQDERFEVCLAYVEETAVETSHMKGAKEFLEKEKLDYCRYEDLDFETYCPHIVFIQFPYDAACHTPETLSLQFKKRGIRVIYIPYGIEISDTQIARKDHFSSFVVENAWRIYTSCYGLKKEYDKYCHNREAVRVCGSPKFDAISRREEYPIDPKILKKAKGRKIIVWKMHFPKKVNENGNVYQITPYIQEYLNFASRIDRYHNLFFVILAHPKMLNGVVASDVQNDDTLMLQVKELLEILEKKENVHIDREDDYRNSLYHGEAVIMDRSAVMIEAAMTGVPVLVMKNEDYEEPMTWPVDKVVRTFYQGTKCGDIEAFLNDFERGMDQKAKQRRETVQEIFPYNDGKNGFRIVNDILKGLQEQPKKPKVILYGIGEICRYYMEKQRWGTEERFEILAVADSNPLKWNTLYYGFPVVGPAEVKKTGYDAIVIMTEPHYFEIKKSLVYDYYLDERRIWRLDDFVIGLWLQEKKEGG